MRAVGAAGSSGSVPSSSAFPGPCACITKLSSGSTSALYRNSPITSAELANASRANSASCFASCSWAVSSSRSVTSLITTMRASYSRETPIATIAGKRSPLLRWKVMSNSPSRPPAVAARTARMLRCCSGGQYGSGVHAPTSSSRLNPVMSHIAWLTAAICPLERSTTTPSRMAASTVSEISRSAPGLGVGPISGLETSASGRVRGMDPSIDRGSA